ncbi:hypothetical protein Tco_0997221 [Tanacetum coccineum]
MDMENLFSTQEYYSGQGSGHDYYAGQGLGGNQEFYTGQDYSMGHGSAQGSAPVEDDSLVEEVAAPTKGNKVSKCRPKTIQPKESFKTSPWTIAEEIALCQVWCDVSENNIIGNAMKSKGFWLKVIEYFEKETGNESGSCDLTVYQKACVKYAAEYDHDFSLESMQLVEEEVREVRPMSRDRARSKKSSTSSRSEASSVAGGGIVDMVADKWKSFKALGWGKKNEQQQSYIDLKNQELDIPGKANREAAELKRQKL